MKCLNCGNEFPEDSIFCPFCGSKIDFDAIRAAEEEARRARETEERRIAEEKARQESESFAPRSRNIIQTAAYDNAAITAEDIEKAVSQSVKNTIRKSVILPVLLVGVIIAGLVGFEIYSRYRDTAMLEKELAFVSHWCHEKSVGNRIGKTNNFVYTDVDCVTVYEGEDAYVNVTCKNSSSIGVIIDDKNIVSVKWSDTWSSSGANDVKITGLTPGVSLCTFTNDGYCHTAEVLVIVLPNVKS